jgi:iron-sulfur cluster assembly protein
MLKLCEKTLKHFKHIVKQNNANSLLISIKGGGCNGFKYNIEPTTSSPEKYDETLTLDGLNIHLCGKSLIYLIGTEIKWKEDIMGSRLEFNNPNAQGTCGCGDTFSL